MGQKVNPHGFRVGPTLFKGWESVFICRERTILRSCCKILRLDL